MNKKLKKILFIITIVIISVFLIKKLYQLNIARNLSKMKKSIISMYKESYPEDNFYFVNGPDYNWDFGSINIRYRGIISSDILDKLGYYQGIEIGLEKHNEGVDVSEYKDMLNYLDVYLPLRQEAKNVFGDNLIFAINGTYTDSMHENIKSRIGINMERQKKTGLGAVIFTMFVDDLEKDVMEKQEEWKEKILTIGKRYWQYYNVTASLQLYIFDRKLLYSHDLAWASVGGIKNTDMKLKGYLEKIRSGDRLTLEEEAYVLGRMRSGYSFISVSSDYYNYKNIRSFKLRTDDIREEEKLILENVIFDDHEWAWNKNKED